jgi:hypothetical protein
LSLCRRRLPLCRIGRNSRLGAPERIVPLPIMGAVVAYLIIRLSL